MENKFKKKKTLGIQELVFIGESQFFLGGGEGLRGVLLGGGRVHLI